MDNTIKELLLQIENVNGHFPHAQIEEIIDRKDEAIPLLMDVLKDVPDNPDRYAESGCFIHIYAAYLLAQFRVKEAFPLFMRIMNMSGEAPYELYGDSLTEDGGRIMASLFDGNLTAIKELIEDEKADESVSAQALVCLVILVVNDILDRNEIVQYMTGLLEGKLRDYDSEVMSWVVDALTDLYPEESYETIKKAYENQDIDEFIISLESVNYALKRTKEEVLRDTKNNHHRKYIDDSIHELSNWAAFNNTPEDYLSNELKRVENSFGKKKVKERTRRKEAKKQKRKNRKK